MKQPAVHNARTAPERMVAIGRGYVRFAVERHRTRA
jgi:hypothetical protein